MSEKDPTPTTQPALRRGRPAGTPQYQAGAKRSVGVLRELRFDPITKLVERYREMEKEVAYWKAIRDRTLIEVMNAEGKERYYNSDAHMAAEKMLMDIGDKLLRYGYGRVPETVNVNDNRPPPLIVNLTKDGDKQLYINDDPNYLEHEEG